MLVISRIAASASSTSRHETRPAQPTPAKIAASDARSSRVSSRRPPADSKPYARAIPPSIPSKTCPNAMRASPTPKRPAASATPAAALAPNAAPVTCARDRLLQRRAPVVAAFVPQPHGAEIERRLDHVIDVDAHPKGVGEHPVAPLESHRLHAQRGGEEVCEDRHGVAAPAGAARRPESQTRPTPAPIHARSRTRLTMAVYTPSAGSRPRSWKRR